MQHACYIVDKDLYSCIENKNLFKLIPNYLFIPNLISTYIVIHPFITKPEPNFPYFHFLLKNMFPVK